MQSGDGSESLMVSETSDYSGIELEEPEKSQTPKSFGSNESLLSQATLSQLDLVIRYLSVCIACNGSALSRSLPKQKDLFQWVEQKIEQNVTKSEIVLFCFYVVTCVLKQARNLLIDWSVLKARNSNHINTQFCSLNHVREYLKKRRKQFVERMTPRSGANMNGNDGHHNSSNTNNSADDQKSNDTPKENNKEVDDVDDDVIPPTSTDHPLSLFDSELPTHHHHDSIVTPMTHDDLTPSSNVDNQMDVGHLETHSGDTVGDPLSLHEKDKDPIRTQPLRSEDADISDTENASQKKNGVTKEDISNKDTGLSGDSVLSDSLWALTPLLMCTSIPSTLAPTISTETDCHMESVKIVPSCYDADQKESNEILMDKIQPPAKPSNIISCSEKSKPLYDMKTQRVEDLGYLEWNLNKVSNIVDENYLHTSIDDNNKDIGELIPRNKSGPSPKRILFSSMPLTVNGVDNIP
ncbi:hypothetical protein RFI_08362 [Reticulomyxa filosa]|uniref:Uncharacterized protein n=1 Tax=Reticulomyxa filosa TaxID=46433 RepID=X6NS49_RETFI|nr:hypothetical protein RFI_08362 [Reticulomyxa filosa]|eukprot:ETO28763.1 hypothetical protein RFI_08362 [Reticulomyxa filosa]